MIADPLVLNPGDLRHLVTISAPTPHVGTFAPVSDKWTLVLTTRAALKQITAKTMYQTGAILTQASHTLRMRYTPTSIKPGYQVTYSTKTYRVVNVDNVLERNRVLELLLLEINGSA